MRLRCAAFLSSSSSSSLSLPPPGDFESTGVDLPHLPEDLRLQVLLPAQLDALVSAAAAAAAAASTATDDGACSKMLVPLSSLPCASSLIHFPSHLVGPEVRSK